MNDNIKLSKCDRLKAQFQNVNINYLNQESSIGLPNIDLFNSKMSNDAEVLDGTNKKLYWIRFNFASEIEYCKLCNTIHSTNDDTESNEDIETNKKFNLIERINNTALFKLNSSITIKKQDKNEEFRRLYSQIKNKLDLLEKVLENFIDFSNNYELKLSKNCSLIKQKIFNSIENRLIRELTENRMKIIGELLNYQQKCLTNVDVDGSKWNSFKSFLSKHQINGKTVSFYLNQESASVNTDDSLLEEINFFKTQLDERVADFKSHIFMHKKISLVFKFSTDFEKQLTSFINFTEFMPKNKLDSSNKFSIKADPYRQLMNVFNQQIKHLNATNVLDFDNKIKENKEGLCMSCHLTGISDEILICSRYTTKTNSSIYTNCDLYLYDIDGQQIRQASITDCHVRHIATSSNFILLTAEYEQKLNFSINKLFNTKCFELLLFNFNLEQVKSIKVESNLKTNQSLFYPQCLCIDRDKIYIMKNVAPFIFVYDTALNLIGKFGQDFSKQFSYYMTPLNVKSIRAINNKLYLQRNNSDINTSNMIIMDLFTGITLKKVNIPYQFSNFYITKNEVIFLVDKTNDLILYNLDSEVTTANTALKEIIDENNSNEANGISPDSKNVIDSYCLTSSGYFVCLFSEKSLIGIY